MASPISLTKTKPNKQFMTSLFSCYKNIAGGADYASRRWERWAKSADISVCRASCDGKRLGWVVYDGKRSTVEVICLSSEWEGKGFEPLIMDALIERENLVAAEILKTDQKKYEWLMEYGFRPTRSFTDQGLPLLRMDLSTSVLMERFKGVEPAKPYRRKERVVIEKVPETETDEEIRKGLKSLIDKLGGLKRFVAQGQKVVIKPNVVSDHGLRDGEYKGGIVTDVRVVKALTELLLPVAGEVIIAEGSSINRSETSKMFAHYGYDRLVELDRKKVRLVDLNGDELVEKTVPGGKRMVSRKIPRTLEEADLIISVPVLKIHFAAIASLAIKHLQGAVPPLEKYMTHFFGLWQNLVNIHHLVKPGLTIIDGLTGQEDFGPVSGTPKRMGLLIGGTNPVAIDAVAMRIMGLDPVTSPPVWMAYMQGLGPIEEEKITVIGPSVKDVANPFRQPVIDLSGGTDIAIYGEHACPGCKGYLHFVLSKLRRPDPKDPKRSLIDRPFDGKVNIYLGPTTEGPIDPEARNVFMGLCQQHHQEMGVHLPGCPPHAEVIVNGIFGLFPDIERPQYADKSEEAKLGEMLDEILRMNRG